MARLIDADEMLKRIESWNTSDAMDKALYNFTLHRIIEQPTVDAEPVKHGRFIRFTCGGFDEGYPTYYVWKCSECECDFEDEEPHYNYCPNCGAKMEKEEERQLKRIKDEEWVEMLKAIAEAENKREEEKNERSKD